MRYISQFEASDIDSDDIDLRFEVDGTETGTTVSIVDECGHAAQIITALLDELETKEEQRANWFQMAQKLGEDLDAAEKRNAEQREYYEGVIADGSKRIAELEAREVTLPQRLQPGADGYDDWYVHSADDGEYLKADDVIEAIRAAGIKVKVE